MTTDVTRTAILAAAQIIKARKNRYTKYLDDPVGFIRDILGEHAWSKQREVAESVRDHRHTLVRSAHDTGKSFIASRLAAWWLSVHEPGEAFVVTTAPTFAQVRAILWREIGRAHRNGKLPGTTNQTEWWINDEIVAYGRKPADYEEHAFQGIHQRYVLVIMDEACGIPAQLWTAVETITTNENARILAIGNPDTPLSEFKRAADSGTWNVIHIDGLESPNFTTEFDDEHVDPAVRELLSEVLLSRTWVEERRSEWGEDSSLWDSKVRGNFPLVPQGQVYQELSPSQQWFGPLPTFKRLVGGLDFGGANDQAHKTAGVVAGIARDDSVDLPKLTPAGTDGVLVRTHHFEHSGPLVHDQLIQWMRDVETHYGRRVEWKADKSQMFGITLARNLGFQIQETHGGADSVWIGIGMVRRRMAQGSAFFTEELTHRPKFLSGEYAGQDMSGNSWYSRMSEYRWQQQPDEDKAVPGVPIKRDDDTADAERYLEEAADGFPMDTSSPIAPTYISGRKRRGVVV